MPLWKKIAIALTTATLLYGGQIRMFTNSRNRFLENWDRIDAFSLIAGILLLTGIALGAYLFTLRFCGPLARRALRHAFVGVFGIGLTSSLLTYFDYKSEIILIGLAALITYSWCRPQSKVVPWAANVALILSPMFPVLLFQLMTYPEWASPEEPLPTPETIPKEASPVFLFIFDEWSYARSVENHEFLSFSRNLREVCEQSFFFSEARSPGANTDVAIPRILFQTNAVLNVASDRAYWTPDGISTPTTQARSLFQPMRELGYKSHILGFYLPYRKLLGPQVDFVRSHIERPKPEGIVGRIWFRGLENSGFLLDPVSQRFHRFRNNSFGPNTKTSRHARWYELNQTLTDEAVTLIRQVPNNSISLIHIPFPHSPFIFEADGSFREGSEPHTSNNPKLYENHLRHLDRVIGKFLDALRESGKFDNSMIILTSDHSWRKDFIVDGKLDKLGEVLHVPLVIKWPHQQNGVRIDRKFPLVRIGDLIHSAILETPNEKAANTLIESMSSLAE